MVRAIVTFDVHSQKVNRDITKILKANGFRIQNSVYEINIYKSDSLSDVFQFYVKD